MCVCVCVWLFSTNNDQKTGKSRNKEEERKVSAGVPQYFYRSQIKVSEKLEKYLS